MWLVLSLLYDDADFPAVNNSYLTQFRKFSQSPISQNLTELTRIRHGLNVLLWPQCLRWAWDLDPLLTKRTSPHLPHHAPLLAGGMLEMWHYCSNNTTVLDFLASVSVSASNITFSALLLVSPSSKIQTLLLLPLLQTPLWPQQWCIIFNIFLHEFHDNFNDIHINSL